MTNLFGRGKEPFWQQASTNLVKFVILLHQIARRLRHALPGLRARHQSGQAPRQDRGRRAALRRQQPTHRRRQARAPVDGRSSAPGRGTTRTTGTETWTRLVRRTSRTRSTQASIPYRDRSDAPPATGRSRQDGAVRGRQAVVRRRLDAHRAEAPHVHRRGHQRVPVAVRRQPAGQAHLLSAEGHLRSRRAIPTASTACRCRRSPI